MLPRLVSRFPATAAEGGCMTPRNLMLSTATAARAIGITDSRLPVLWLGSKMIGRCDSRCAAGMTARSGVKREWSPKVLMPRSHKIT